MALFGIAVTAASLWVLSGLSRSNSAEIALGIAGGALLVSVFGRRWFLRFVSVAASLAVAVLLVEGALRMWPRLLSGPAANAAFHKYHVFAGGMYERDPELGWALRPSVDLDAFWNGYWWRHATNARGYRGAFRERADVVFLGDSMIYGHGVEAEATVSERFAERSGLSVANLGQQGTSPLQAWVSFLRNGAPLAPERIILALHPNDVEDAVRIYSLDELRRFAATDAPTLQARREVAQAAGPAPLAWWNERLAPSLAVAFVGTALREVPTAAGSPTTSRDPFVPTDEEMGRVGQSQSHAVEWAAIRAAIRRLVAWGHEHDASVTLFDLGWPLAHSEAVERMADEINATYSTAGRIALDRARTGEPVYLPNDGHWTKHGAQIVADELLR